MARFAPIDCAAIVAGVRANDAESMDELYKVFSRGMRYYICRQLGPQDIEDHINNTWIAVVKSVKSGALREPHRLMGYIKVVVKRAVYQEIEYRMLDRKRHEDDKIIMFTTCDTRANPEIEMQITEARELIQAVLKRLGTREREVLTRFYLDEQTEMQIRAEMGMTETQFRLFKSRAKDRFGRIGRNMLNAPLATRLISHLSGRTN